MKSLSEFSPITQISTETLFNSKKVTQISLIYLKTHLILTDFNLKQNKDNNQNFSFT